MLSNNSQKISSANRIAVPVTTEKIKPEGNLRRERLSLPLKKSALAVLVLPATILLLTGLVVLRSPACSPVSLHLKAWGFEYQLQKGSCNIPQLLPQ